MGNVDTNYLTSALAITKDVWKAELKDNFFYENVALNEIKNKSTVEIMDNGKYLQVPIMIGGNSNSASFEYYDTIGTSTQKGFVDATFEKKRYGVTVPVSDQELEENGGVAKVVDLYVSRIKQASNSVFKDINEDLYLDGTGNSGKNILGLAAMISETPIVGSYASVNPAVITSWANRYNTGAIATLIADMDTQYYSAVNGRIKPNMILTNALGVKSYLTANRTTSGGAGIAYTNADKADAGFINVQYNGIDMMLDTMAPSNSSYPIYWFLNTNSLGFFFKMGDFKAAGRTAGQFADTIQAAVVCQLYTNARRDQGKLKITA